MNSFVMFKFDLVAGKLIWKKVPTSAEIPISSGLGLLYIIKNAMLWTQNSKYLFKFQSVVFFLEA